jgi:quercetin dioxygenase-like cupin family protein
MWMIRSIRTRVILAGSFAVLALALVAAAQTERKPVSKLIELDPAATTYMRVLGGPPETETMRSGYVVLEPSKSVGKHNTEAYEEVVIVLSGVGEMRSADGPALKLKPYVVAYCPPDTEHDVVNTGSEPLRYVYVVAKTR